MVGGCFTVDATLNADGSGKIRLSYMADWHATRASETARFTSAHVTAQSVVADGARTVLEATFDDVTKLSTAEGFRNVTVKRTPEAGGERLHIVIRNPLEREFPEEGGLGDARITLTLPGRAIEANRGGELSGSRVTWSVPFAEYIRNPSLEFEVRYALPDGEPGTPPTTRPSTAPDQTPEHEDAAPEATGQTP